MLGLTQQDWRHTSENRVQHGVRSSRNGPRVGDIRGFCPGLCTPARRFGRLVAGQRCAFRSRRPWRCPSPRRRHVRAGRGGPGVRARWHGRRRRDSRFGRFASSRHECRGVGQIRCPRHTLGLAIRRGRPPVHRLQEEHPGIQLRGLRPPQGAPDGRGSVCLQCRRPRRRRWRPRGLFDHANHRQSFLPCRWHVRRPGRATLRQWTTRSSG